MHLAWPDTQYTTIHIMTKEKNLNLEEIVLFRVDYLTLSSVKS